MRHNGGFACCYPSNKLSIALFPPFHRKNGRYQCNSWLHISKNAHFIALIVRH